MEPLDPPPEFGPESGTVYVGHRRSLPTGSLSQRDHSKINDPLNRT